MKKGYLLFIFCCSFLPSLIAQCNISVSFSDSTVGCGSPIAISAFGNSPGAISTNTFNMGTLGAGWTSTQSLLFTNPCGPSLDGSPSAWFGDCPLPRTLSTNSFDVSCGGEVCFDLDFGAEDTCGMCTDCEDPDLLDEGVFFQYSIDGGLTWVDIFYFEPDSGNLSAYYQWNNYCFLLPPGCWTASTLFRWNQTDISSNIHDNWGIDNFTVTPWNCNYDYDWAHVPGFPDDPNQIIIPGDTTTYFVTLTNGIVSCTDSVLINVVPMEIEIVTPSDTIDCGNCVALSVESVVGSFGAYKDDFESGTNQAIWGDINNGTISTVCATNGTGNSLFFDGAQPGGRYAQTVPIDASASGFIDFCLYMGNSSLPSGSPCDNCEAGDDVRLEYSIDNGVTFVSIATYDQVIWDSNPSQQCFSNIIPIGAQTNATIFRWRQLAFLNSPGFDTWNLDEVKLFSPPATVSFDWTTGVLNNPSSSMPIACPLSDTLYTVSVLNTANGCNATDTMTLFVEPCTCDIFGFDGDLTILPNGQVDVTGFFQFANSPTTGTLEVEAINGTGTYTQTFNAPFTDSLVYNFSIPGMTNDGSDVILNLYFSDSLSCNETLIIQIPTNCLFVNFDGNAVVQANGLIDVNGSVLFSASPTSGTLEVVAGNSLGAFVQSFNAPFTNNLIYNYSITGIPNDSAAITMVVYFSDSLACVDTLNLPSTVGIELIDGQENECTFSPNPVFEEAKLVFENETQEKLIISIMNEHGQVVLEKTTMEEAIFVKGSDLRQGLYFFSVKSDEGGELCSGKFAVIR